MKHADGSEVFTATAEQIAERELEDRLELELARVDLDGANERYARAEAGVQKAQSLADEAMRDVATATARLRAAQRKAATR